MFVMPFFEAAMYSRPCRRYRRQLQRARDSRRAGVPGAKLARLARERRCTVRW